MINFSGRTRFKLKQGESLTIPSVVSSPSPSNASSGVSPTTTFDGKREVVGGLIYDAFSDAAGPTAVDMAVFDRLRPNDVVAVSAVVSNAATVSVNGVVIFTITGVTTVCGIVGAYG